MIHFTTGLRLRSNSHNDSSCCHDAAPLAFTLERRARPLRHLFTRGARLLPLLSLSRLATRCAQHVRAFLLAAAPGPRLGG
jgi:hypothetical protein